MDYIYMCVCVCVCVYAYINSEIWIEHVKFGHHIDKGRK